MDVDVAQDVAVHLSIEGQDMVREGGAGQHVFELPNEDYWSVDTPTLHTLSCRLQQSDGSTEELSLAFGMRDFRTKDYHFRLNNRPIFLKGVTYHGPPLDGQDPEFAAAVRSDLSHAKKARFNLIRLETSSFINDALAQAVLRTTDELGLLVYVGGPEGLADLAAGKTPSREETPSIDESAVRRFRNHPSLVMWGLPATTNEETVAELRRHDPTRIWVVAPADTDASSGRGRLYPPYTDGVEPIDELYIHQRSPESRVSELYFQHSGESDMTVFLCEFGITSIQLSPHEGGNAKGGARGCSAEELDGAILSRGLERFFKTSNELTSAIEQDRQAAILHQGDAIRSNTKVGGYCYARLRDAKEFTYGLGILDCDGKPKAALRAFEMLHQPIRPLIHLPRTNLLVREEIPVTVSLLNEIRREGRAELSLQVVGPTNQVLWKKKRTTKIPKSGKELWAGSIGASGSPGTHRFVVRLMGDEGRLAESATEFYVHEPLKPSADEINVLDPQRRWREPCASLARITAGPAALYVVPPLGNTIRAYPAEGTATVLGRVHGGAVAIFFGLPNDWNDLASQFDDLPSATARDACWGKYHYSKLHPVFEGLSAGGLLPRSYANILAPKTFAEDSEEDACGSLDTTALAQSTMEKLWGHDILVKRFGAGRLVFSHMPILEHLGDDPLAERIFVNMVHHFSRLATPTLEPMANHQQIVEWMRKERAAKVRRWKVIGMFPNWGGGGHDTEYPPEKERDFTATYPGWYRSVSWQDWCSLAHEDHRIDLQAALSPVYQAYPRRDSGTAYAYAEFTADSRQAVAVSVKTVHAAKIWLNDHLLHEEGCPSQDSYVLSANLKQGRNAFLLKLSKIPGPFEFSLDMNDGKGNPVGVAWWR